MPHLFSVTYSIVTPESAEIGDYDDSGYIAQRVTLREAIDLVFSTRTSQVGGVECIEPNESPMRAPDWVTVTNGGEYITGAQESRGLHIPGGVTPASACRIARLMGA